MYWIDGIALINKALEKRSEQREWEMWVSLYPNMDKKTFIPFDKFRGKSNKSANTASVERKKMTKEEILEKAEELRKLHQGTHEGVMKDGNI